VYVTTGSQALAPILSTTALLQSALSSGNAVRAASLFSLSSRARYLATFNALGTRLSSASSYLSNLTPISIDQGIAQASFPAVVNGMKGYLTIELIKDAGGIWRVESW
jgi:hypothetical protein